MTKAPHPFRCAICFKLIRARPDLAHKPGAPTREQRLINHMRDVHDIKVAT